MDYEWVIMMKLMDGPRTRGEYLHRVKSEVGKGRVVVLVSERKVAVAQALFLAYMKEEKVADVAPNIA